MNYSKIYKDLVNKAKDSKRSKVSSTYYESHHILPKSMGGGNEKSNLVLFTAREHYVAHRLLTKIYPNSWKMKYALLMMSHENMISSKGVIINSNTYEKLRHEVREMRKSSAFIEGCLEFDNNIPLSVRVTSKLRSRWRWTKSTKTAVSVIITNGILGYEQGVGICYRRSRTAYSKKNGKSSSSAVLRNIDMLVGMGYIEEIRSDGDLPVSKRKLSVYRLTKEGYTVFTTLGAKI